MKKIIYFFTIIVVLTSCKHGSRLANKVQLKPTTRIVLPFDKKADIPMGWDVCTVEDTSFLLHTFYDIKGEHPPKLRLYDLEGGRLLHESCLPSTFQGKKPAYVMRMIDKQHIFLYLYCGSPPSFSEDSTLLLVDYKGRVYKVFDTGRMDTPYDGMEFEEMETKHCMSLGMSSRICVDSPDGWLYIPFRRPTLGYDSAAISYPLPPVAAYNVSTDSFVYFKDYVYPNHVLNNCWGEEVHTPRITMSLQNKPLIQFGYTPTIWEWDVKRNKTVLHRIRQPVIMDSVRPFSKLGVMPEYADFYNRETGAYAHLSTQPHNKQYVWWVALPKDYYGVHGLTGYSHTGFVVLDENFRTLGEGTTEIPVFFTMPKPLGGGFITADAEANIKSFGAGGDSAGIHFLTFELQIDSTQKVEPKPRQKFVSRELVYLKKHFPGVLAKERSVVVITPINAFCQKCLNRLEDEVTDARTAPKYEGTFILYLSENGQKHGNPYLLSPKPPAGVIADLNAKYENYFAKPNSPVVYFLRNGKIVFKQAITVQNETVTLQEIQGFLNPPPR